MSKGFSSQWIEPDFNDFSNFTAPSSSNFVPRKAPVRKTIRDLKSVKPKSKNDVSSSEFFPFVIKYEPQTVNDLAVHVKKLNEIEQWLISATLTKQTSKFLLLLGPTGCGKTAAIKTLTKKLRLQIVEWSNGQNYRTFNNGDNYNNTEINQSNQTKDFSDFLLRAEKCSALNVSTTNNAEQETFSGKIIVVEEFPNSFILQPQLLWTILRRIHKTVKFPIVFICSDSQNGHEREQFNWKRLFPVNVRDEFKICSVSFNPVSRTSIIKVLRNILEQENAHKTFSHTKKQKRSADQDPLDQIAKASNGDLRSAINSLEFFISDEKCGSAAFRNDSPMLLFRALGKFLYSKRIEPSDGDDIQILTNSSTRLPSHLKQFSRENEVNFDPEMVVEQSGMNADLFAMFLHENYTDFIVDIDAAVEITSIFSYADILTARWSTNEQIGVYSSSLVGRSVAFHCYSQTLEKAWRQMRKPVWLTTNKNARKNFQQLTENFETLETRFGSAFALDIVPYLTKLPHVRLKSASQWQVVEDMGRMPINMKKSFKRFGNASSFQRKTTTANNQDEDLSIFFDDDDDDDMALGVSSSSQADLAVDDNEIDKETLSMIEEYDD